LSASLSLCFLSSHKPRRCQRVHEFHLFLSGGATPRRERVIVQPFKRADALLRGGNQPGRVAHIRFAGAALLFTLVAFRATLDSPRSVPVELDLRRRREQCRCETVFGVANGGIGRGDEALCKSERGLSPRQVRECVIVLTTAQLQGGSSAEAKWSHVDGRT
jgi:hypothetical protein